VKIENSFIITVLPLDSFCRRAVIGF